MMKMKTITDKNHKEVSQDEKVSFSYKDTSVHSMLRTVKTRPVNGKSLLRWREVYVTWDKNNPKHKDHVVFFGAFDRVKWWRDYLMRVGKECYTNK